MNRPALAFLICCVLIAACGTRVKGDGPAQGTTPAVQARAAPSPVPEAGAPSGQSETTIPTGAPVSSADRPTGSAASTPAGQARTRATATSNRAVSSAAASASFGAPPSALGAGNGRETRPGPDAVAPSAAPVGSRSPVTVGTLGTFSGPGGELLKDPATAVQAWIKAVNTAGGVNGHPVRHVMADDGGDPARHRALERQMVEKDKILAFLYKAEVFAGFDGPDPYVIEKKIPVVGVDLGEDYVYESPFYFPQGPSGQTYSASFLGAWDEGVPRDQRRFGSVVCAESPSCGTVARVWQQRAGEFGFQPVFDAKASIAQPDYTAECLAARNAGVQALAVGLDEKSIVRLARSCDRQGFRPRYLIPGLNARGLDDEALLDGAVIGSGAFAWPAADNPARREFRDTLARLLPGVQLNAGLTYGWVAAKVFEIAMTAVTEPPTTDSILRGLWEIRNDDLGGLAAPLSYFSERGVERKICWSLVVIADQRFTAPKGGGVRCRP